MKKFLLVTTLVSGLVLPQVAHAGGEWIGPLVGGIFAGAILNEMGHDHRYDNRYDRRYYYPQYPQRVCQRIDVYDRYGNYVGQQIVCRDVD